MSTDLLIRTERQKIIWTNSIAFALLHGGALAALFMFSWRACGVAVFLHWMTAGLGISMGYHRLHTHRSYQVPLALEYFFAVVARWRSKVDRSSGLRHIEFTTRNPISPVIRTHPVTAAGGLTSAGFLLEIANTAINDGSPNTRQISRKIVFTCG